MHFILCGGVVDLDFFACSNVLESSYTQAAEIQKDIRLAAVI